MKVNEQPILNDRDCPIVILSELFVCIPSRDILTPISILHECNGRCFLQMTRKRKQVEREMCDLNSQTVVHNYKRNNMFVINIYCMKTIYCTM